MARSTADIICVQEAADRMGRNPVTIKKWIRAGSFPGYQPSPGEYVVTRQMFERYLAGEFRPAGSKEEGEAA